MGVRINSLLFELTWEAIRSNFSIMAPGNSILILLFDWMVCAAMTPPGCQFSMPIFHVTSRYHPMMYKSSMKSIRYGLLPLFSLKSSRRLFSLSSLSACPVEFPTSRDYSTGAPCPLLHLISERLLHTPEIESVTHKKRYGHKRRNGHSLSDSADLVGRSTTFPMINMDFIRSKVICEITMNEGSLSIIFKQNLNCR